MLHIECPWCGFRDDAEFHYGGEAHITRPNPSETLTDEKFSEYLFLKTNTKGLLLKGGAIGPDVVGGSMCYATQLPTKF